MATSSEPPLVSSDGIHFSQAESEEPGEAPKPEGSSLDQEKENIKRRVRTFTHFRGLVEIIKLAIAGFYFIGPKDRVECGTCKTTVEGWSSGQIPLDVHRAGSPNCAFLKRWFPLSSKDSFSTGGVHTGFSGIAKYKEFTEFAHRVATFVSWPHKTDLHSPSNLAQSGFFYIGSSDRTRCFCCGITLRDWGINDDPFKVHIQYGKKCAYIKYIHENGLETCNPHSLQIQNTSPTCRSGTRTANIPATQTSSNCRDLEEDAAVVSDASGVPPSINNAGRDVFKDGSESKWEHTTQVEAVLHWGFALEDIQEAIRVNGRHFEKAMDLFQAVENLKQPVTFFRN